MTSLVAEEHIGRLDGPGSSPGPLKLAIVGCGAISEWHRRAIARIPEIRITAAVDIDEARARAAAAVAGAAVFTSLDDALARGEFDAVDVMLPHDLHERAATAVLKAGKHLLLEKPLAPDLAACERILALARGSGRVFMVGETAQYWAEVLVARRLVQEGSIGALLKVSVLVHFPPSSEFYSAGSWRMRNSAAGGGVALDAGPHFVRALRLICGEFTHVFAAFGRSFEAMEGESQVHALLRGPGQLVATLDLLLTEGTVAPQDTFRITGTHGEIVIDHRGVRLYTAERPAGELVLEARPEGYFASFLGELEDFAGAVLHGRPLAAPAERARDEVAIALAMQRAAHSGHWERI